MAKSFTTEYWFSNRLIWPIDGNIKGATTLDYSITGRNGNEELLYTSQIFRTGVSLSDEV